MCDMVIKRRKWTLYEVLSLLCAHDYACAKCRKKLPAEVEIDHIVPLKSKRWRVYDERTAFRLANHVSNLQPLCPNCHAQKSRREMSTLEYISKRHQKEYTCLKCKRTTSKYFLHECHKPTPNFNNICGGAKAGKDRQNV